MAENHFIDELIAGCIAGKRGAQVQLYDQYYRSMAAICMRYTKNREDAVEVLNDGFIKVFKNIQQYNRVKASLYTWMRTIMINTAIDAMKRQQPAFVELNLAQDEEPAIDNTIVQQADADELLALIRQLPAVDSRNWCGNAVSCVPARCTVFSPASKKVNRFCFNTIFALTAGLLVRCLSMEMAVISVFK